MERHAAGGRGVLGGWARWAALAVTAGLAGACVSPRGSCETVYEWRTLTGAGGGLGNVDGDGAAARFCQPHGLAYDAAGSLVVADFYNHALRRVTPEGRVTTWVGAVGESGVSDGPGSVARFDRPCGVAADRAGAVAVADSGSHTVRRVTSGGAVTTLAGRAGEAGAADGTGGAARFRGPCGVAYDAAGNLYVADSGNHTLRKVSAAGAVTTLAGRAGEAGAADGAGGAARFRSPRGVAADAAGNLYVADTDNAVLRRVSPAGAVVTVAGCPGVAGYADGTGAVARFSAPWAVSVGVSGEVYVADAGNRAVRRVSPGGQVTTVTNGLAWLRAPRGVAADARGGVAVSDSEAQVVGVAPARGMARVLAGKASGHGAADGAADAARFSRPCGVAAVGGGRLVVADNFSHTLREVAADGGVTTRAGRAGAVGGADGAGTNATFFWPSGLSADGAGGVYVADAGNHTVRRLAADGAVTTVAGKAGQAGAADAAGGAARFSWPSDVAADGAGNVYVADRANHLLRKVAADGTVTTVAGQAGQAGAADGRGGAARFNSPGGVAVDVLGTVYVADTGNQTVRVVTPAGEVLTRAGCPGIRGSADGVGVLARFNGPAALTVDGGGNLYVADRDNHLIRRVAADGTVTTLGGLPQTMACEDGVGREARFAQPSGIGWLEGGVLVVADACNNRLVTGTPLREERRLVAARRERGAAAAAGRASAGVGAGVEEERYVWEVFAGRPGEPGEDDGAGGAARLRGPQGLALAADGTLLVADGVAGSVRAVSPRGEVRTVAGRGAALTAPVAVAVDAAGVCTVADAAHALVAVTRRGEVRPLAGAPGQRGALDGVGAAARFDCVAGVALDAGGVAWVADYHNRVVRRVTPDGAVTTVAGKAGQAGAVDGAGAAARFAAPLAVAADGRGGAYVADGDRLRHVTSAGAVSTVVGAGVFGRLDGVASDGAGTVYVADRGRQAVWKVTSGGRVVRLGGSAMAMAGSGWLVTGLAVDREGRLYLADASRACVVRGVPEGRR